MKVLVIGGGGREHALAWKLHGEGAEILAAPGNPGIAELGTCLAASASDFDALVTIARRERVAFTMVGPEAPLAAGLVDRFRVEGLAAFGPTAAAAQVEASKRFSKEVMVEAGVPTAHASTHTDVPSAMRAAHGLGAPVVIKASGLAAGKGVVVAMTMPEAEAAILMMLEGNAFGAAGHEVLVEEFMEGEELSLFAICDGTRALPMICVQDHKRLLAGDLGPNTGGMGAYAPVSIGTRAVVADAEARVFAPMLAAMAARGAPFTGLLYAGLMLTPTGARVVEFNCRFGDPETQALMPLLDSALAPVLQAVASGDGLAGAAPLRWRPAASVCTVLASGGYPETSGSGVPIDMPEMPDGVLAFHAGTRRGATGQLETNGGRVLNIVATAPTMREALNRSAQWAERVRFEGRQFRPDIGWRELARAGAS
jgi:phosphoribosylamine--glycine ligase